jgi:hypothetical protein
MDIELAVDAMELAPATSIHMVFVLRDGDFRSLVEAVQRRGRAVTLDLDRSRPQPPMVADEAAPPGRHLHGHRRVAAKIGRDPSERPRSRRPRTARQRQHTPQFLQRGPPRGAGCGADDDFED